MHMREKGFTLIEILIVVALLGALALGLLATLDPFQQIKKGNDTTRRNMVSDIYRALIAYQANQGSFPWGTTAITARSATDANVSGYLNAVVSAGELKSEFMSVGSKNLGRIFLTSTGTNVDTLNVCFQPESKAFMTDPNTRYSVSGDAGCSSNCYWCVK